MPAVIDDNTAEFKTASVRLFFVMEFIEGKTLADEIRARQRLDLDTAIKLVQNLAATMKLAIENDVIHRDLKPENIMVRRLDPPDIVVLDYGLSFNLAEPKDVTRASESLDNDFLSLPERRVPGGNRRDPRSDTTGLCGILFFCLSGERPVDLRDEQGNPPHRRVGSRSADFTDDPTKARALDSLFGRGFALALGGRFQDVDSFLERLDGVVNPRLRATKEKLSQVTQQLQADMLLHDSKTQLVRFTTAAEAVYKHLDQMWVSVKTQLNEFNSGYKNNAGFANPPGTQLGQSRLYQLWHPQHPARIMAVAYEVRADGTECAVYRAIMEMTQTGQGPSVQRSVWKWESLLDFDGLGDLPNLDGLQKDLEASTVEAVHQLRQMLLG